MAIKPERADWTLLASGRTADIYKTDTAEALKLFHAGYSLVEATREYENSRFIARVYDKTVAMSAPSQTGGRMSLRMELIRGRPLREIGPRGELRQVGLSLGMMHRNLHVRPSEGLPPAPKLFEPFIRDARGISDRDKQRMLAFVRAGRDDRLCHGAFHLGHVMQDVSGWRLIDWKYAYAGDPLADIAATLLALYHQQDAAWGSGLFTPFLRRQLASWYLKGYFGREPVPRREIEQWKCIIALRRSAEAPAGERLRLRLYQRRSRHCFAATE